MSATLAGLHARYTSRRRRYLRGGDQLVIARLGHPYFTPGKPRIDWDDPAAKDTLVSALVDDANALLAALADTDVDDDAVAQAALGLLALVAGQDVEPAEGSDGTDGRWRIARKVSEDRVISTIDPQARHTRKSPENRRDGYRAHVAADPETAIITDQKLSRWSISWAKSIRVRCWRAMTRLWPARGSTQTKIEQVP